MNLIGDTQTDFILNSNFFKDINDLNFNPIRLNEFDSPLLSNLIIFDPNSKKGISIKEKNWDFNSISNQSSSWDKNEIESFISSKKANLKILKNNSFVKITRNDSSTNPPLLMLVELNLSSYAKYFKSRNLILMAILIFSALFIPLALLHSFKKKSLHTTGSPSPDHE